MYYKIYSENDGISIIEHKKLYILESIKYPYPSNVSDKSHFEDILA